MNGHTTQNWRTCCFFDRERGIGQKCSGEGSQTKPSLLPRLQGTSDPLYNRQIFLHLKVEEHVNNLLLQAGAERLSPSTRDTESVPEPPGAQQHVCSQGLQGAVLQPLLGTPHPPQGNEPQSVGEELGGGASLTAGWCTSFAHVTFGKGTDQGLKMMLEVFFLLRGLQHRVARLDVIIELHYFCFHFRNKRVLIWWHII